MKLKYDASPPLLLFLFLFLFSFSRSLARSDACALSLQVYKRWDKQPFESLTLSSLVRILGGTQCSPPVRDALLQFLETAIQNSGNARQLVLASDCVPTLIKLLIRCHTLRAAANPRAQEGVAVSIRSASLLRMLAEKQPGVTGVDNKLVRPVPRAKRMLTDAATFSKLVQMLLYPNRELVAAVMSVIHVVLSKNVPTTIRCVRVYECVCVCVAFSRRVCLV